MEIHGLDYLTEAYQQPWAWRALIASCMVGITCGLLGCFIVLRNMALVGDALAHAILPGVVGAFVLVGYSALGFFTGSVIAGLATAFGITWIQQNVKTKNDAAIGIVFTAMFAVGVMGISWISRSEGVHLDLKDFLFGNMLGVGEQDLWLTGVVMIYTAISIATFYRFLFATTFQPAVARTMGISVSTMHYFLMLLLSFAVVASLQTVGVILVVAMLITPAATALLLSNRLQHVLLISAAVGLLSAALGLNLAILFGTTPGPAIVVTATLIYLLTVFLAPERGLLFRAVRRGRLHQRILQEDILKYGARMEEQSTASIETVSSKLGVPSARVRQAAARLQRRGWLRIHDGGQRIEYLPAGKKKARQLTRAHRLWETYLVEKLGMDAEHIHEDAERYEHLLPKELLLEMERDLGHPQVDPHGAPIPRGEE